MMRKSFMRLTSHVLCVLLAWTTVMPASAQNPALGSTPDEDALRLQYPDARFIHVDAKDYAQLAQQLERRGYQTVSQLAANDQGDAFEPSREQPLREAPRKKGDCGESLKSEPSAGDESLRVMVDFSHDVMHSSGNGNSEGAAVVFVIIGTLLIVVWALYLFKYLYDVAAGFEPCGTWSDLVFNSSFVSEADNQHARFNGLRFSTGFRSGATDVGINVELGDADIQLNAVSSQRLRGTYWMLGPMLRWRFSSADNPHYFQMNFLAGSTEHDELGVIAQANIGLQFAISRNMHLGVSWGAMNIDLKNDQGLVSERDQYYYLYGFNVGMRF